MRCIRRCAVAGALLFATAAAATPPMYKASVIPPLGGDVNGATAINAAGQVAGTSFTTMNQAQHAFVFSGGFVFDLGLPPGFMSSGATGINRHGQVVGYGFVDSTTQRAFVFSGGAYQPFAIPGGFSTGHAINDRAQITGEYDNGTSYAAAGYVLQLNGPFAPIGELEPGGGSQPAAINNKGEVTGLALVAGGIGIRPFLYANGALQDIGIPGPYRANGAAINDLGEIAGNSEVPGGGYQAFLRSSNGMLQYLPTLTPQGSTQPQGINNARQVVGSSSISGPMYSHGFLHDNGVTYDLNDLLLTDLMGREIVSAVAINDSGQIAANACNVNYTNCVAVRLDPFLPAPATVAGDPYGLTVTGGTYVGGQLTLTSETAELQLGATPAPPGSLMVIDFSGFNFAPGTKLTIRSGAANQVVSLRIFSPNATTIAGTVVAASGNGAPPPVLYLTNSSGIAIAAEGSIVAPSGLTLNAHTRGIVNQGTVDGGSSLALKGAMINGSGAYKGNAIRISTTGNVNNPVHGLHYLANGLRLLPSSGGTVALTLNGYGTGPQVFNVRVEGNALVSMPSGWPAGVTDPVNNAPVLPGGFRPAGVPDPAYGGGSLIVQATGGMMLDGGVSHDFVFPGGLVLIAGGSLDFNGVTVDNGWTTGGQAWQGMFFEAPVITSSAGLIDARASDNNWINFNVKPNVGVRAWQLKRVAGGAAQFATADSVAPHLNTYSTQVEVAANGGCWTCTVNPDPVDMY